WNNVKLTLSTAQPMLNAAPPDLRILSVALQPRGAANPNLAAGQIGGFQFGLQGGQPGAQQPQGGNPMNNLDLQQEVYKESQRLRKGAADNFTQKKGDEGGKLINDAAALEQANEILLLEKEDIVNRRNKQAPAREGQSVTYHLA